jgi:hypothetical protein
MNEKRSSSAAVVPLDTTAAECHGKDINHVPVKSAMDIVAEVNLLEDRKSPIHKSSRLSLSRKGEELIILDFESCH